MSPPAALLVLQSPWISSTDRGLSPGVVGGLGGPLCVGGLLGEPADALSILSNFEYTCKNEVKGGVKGGAGGNWREG